MFPGPIKLGPLPIQPYGLMIAIGFMVALFLVGRDARKRGLDPKALYDMGFWGLFIGLAGTRVLHIIMFPHDYSWKDPIGWLAIWRGGLVFQGGPPIAILFFFIYLRKKGIPIGKTCDTFAPFLPIGHAIGRLGCLLKGCCYGAISDVPWAIRFPRVPWDVTKTPEGSPAFLDHCMRFSELSYNDHWSYPVHPTQLYESGALLIIAGIILLLRKKWHPFDGFTLPVYFILYGIARFIIEFFRDDHNPTHIWGLSDQQVISIVFVVAATAGFWIASILLKKRPSQ